MKTIYILAFFGIIYFSSCKSQSYTAANLPENQIVFGKGGGFSGEVTEYILLENGQLFRSSSFEKGVVEINRVDKKLAAQLFVKLYELELAKENFDHPGNMYYFIAGKMPDNHSKVIWGDGKHPVREDIQNFYNSLINLIQSK